MWDFCCGSCIEFKHPSRCFHLTFIMLLFCAFLYFEKLRALVKCLSVASAKEKIIFLFLCVILLCIYSTACNCSVRHSIPGKTPWDLGVFFNLYRNRQSLIKMYFLNNIFFSINLFEDLHGEIKKLYRGFFSSNVVVLFLDTHLKGN